jgi:class 3 adenylate cyclase
MGRAKEGLADLDEALELERALGQTEGEAICLLYRGDALGALGRLDDARDSITAALATFRRLGVREQAANAQWMLGKVEEAAGNLHEAEAITREALNTCPDMPFVFSMATSRLAALLVAIGDLDGAAAFAQRAAREGIPFARYEADLARAEVAVRRGEPDAAVRVAEALALAEAGRCAFSPIRRRLQEMSQMTGMRPPSGTPRLRHRRTFMFTDIVKSTNLVETLGDESWDHLLRWHDETLRSLFRSHRGEEVNRLGDGFFVAFGAPQAAAECAIGIQRALDKHRREHGFSPQVRIGLHEAEATRKEHDYQGKGVHVAARIGAMADGGEILASRGVVACLGRLALSSPRPSTLKGLSEPVEVVSIGWQ